MLATPWTYFLHLSQSSVILTDSSTESPVHVRNVTSAGWQVTLCNPMWYVSFRSSVATLRTAIHLLLGPHRPRRLDRPPPNIFGLTPLIATRAYSTPAGLYSRLPRRRIDATAPTDRPTHNFRRVPLVRRRNGCLSVYNVQTTTIANARKNVK